MIARERRNTQQERAQFFHARTSTRIANIFVSRTAYVVSGCPLLLLLLLLYTVRSPPYLRLLVLLLLYRGRPRLLVWCFAPTETRKKESYAPTAAAADLRQTFAPKFLERSGADSRPSGWGHGSMRKQNKQRPRRDRSSGEAKRRGLETGGHHPTGAEPAACVCLSRLYEGLVRPEAQRSKQM